MTPQEQQRLAQLEAFVSMLMASDRYTFQKHIQMFDGRNIQVGRGIGTKIGTATDQKLSLYGVTPVVQAATITAPTTPGGVYAQAEAQSAVDKINLIRTAIKNVGITA